MDKLKKWSLHAAKVILGLVLFLFLIGFGWWLTRPAVPDTALDLQEEVLASTDYREAADSALVLLRAVAIDLGLPSLSVAVSVNGEEVWAAALGVADLSEDRAVGLRTRYRAGSVSKSITGLAAAKLVEAGRLDLDASVHTYVPSFPEKRWDVTVRQLGAHTGGIPHYSKNPLSPRYWSERFAKHYDSVTDALEIFSDAPLLYEPGTDFEYTTHGFTLLSAALENAAGKPYPDLIDELVWTPFGMSHTRLDDIEQEDPDRAVSYVGLAGRLFHIEGPDPSYKLGSGAILTTPTDLVRMGGAFLTDRIVSAELREDLFTPRPLADGSDNPQGYALGWRHALAVGLLGTPDTLAVIHHGGATPGGSSFILLIPDGKVAAAAMTNVSLFDSWPLRRTIYRIAGVFRAVGTSLDTSD